MKFFLLPIAICSLFAVASFGQTVLLNEGFDTEGHPSRYRASSDGGFRENFGNAYFIRTTGTNPNISLGFGFPYTGIMGTHFWAAEDTDGGGNRRAEQTIVFNPIDIAGVTGLSISGLFGAANSGPPGSSTYDMGDFIQVSYKIDSGTETNVLCFAYENHGPLSGPFGLDADCDGTADNTNGTDRLVRMLTKYSANIPETGNFLTIRIKVSVDGLHEEIAFDDIKVTGIPPAPEPDNPPAFFRASASGVSRISLDWTDAGGTNLPTGYVIHANTTGFFSSPRDNIPPTIDTDLSNGEAVVTVDHGAGSSYTFTGLTALETYYFKIWAYSNEGDRIDYLIPPGNPTISGTVFEPTTVFEEGFETNGHPLRYVASSNGGFDTEMAARNTYFTRTEGNDRTFIQNVTRDYTGFAGDWFWAAENTDGDVGDAHRGDRNKEQTIVFNTYRITGFTGLSIFGLFGVGNESPPTPPGSSGIGSTFSYDADDYIEVTYQIDGAVDVNGFPVETKVLCFAYENHGDENNEPFGLDADCDGEADENGVNRLGTELAEYSANIPETGDMLRVRIKVNVERSGEEIAFDDIKVAGLAPNNPPPDRHPASLTATAFGSSQIVLSWPNVTGANVPTGYVIRAGTSHLLTSPGGGASPPIDEDLSDGDAFVNVFHGDDPSYTFTGLTALETYHFQIWAYSNEGDNTRYLTFPRGPTASVTVFEPDVVLKEGFETDGHPSRYRAGSSGGFHSNNNAYFTRTTGSEPNISVSSGAYTGFSGTHFWAAEHIMGSGERSIVFDDINVRGFTGLAVSGLFGAGNETPPHSGGFSYDAGEYIRVSYEIDDSGVETDVLCFAYENYVGVGNQPLGLDADCDGEADVNGTDRLGTALAAYSAVIPETGTSLTLRIKVFTNGSGEEMAFDDIEVTGLEPEPEPEPDHQPTSFMTTVFSSSQIDLSWTDATGTNLPTGYVIYANTVEGSLPVPTDSMPPMVDTDLSDGEAVVTVFHGDDPGYTFTGLAALETYHFQIWAYSNEGDRIDYLTSIEGPTVSGTVFEPTVVFEEGFETDGYGSRYRASSNGGFRGGNNAHFQRTNGSNISNISREYRGFSNSWFWAAEDTDDVVGNRNKEQTIVFNTYRITGFTGLSIFGLFGAGNERLPGAGVFSYDAGEYIRVSYQIDTGPETDVLCFRVEDHGNTSNNPLGLDADCDGIADNNDGTDRLGTELAEYSANILETGDMLTVRIKVVMDGADEEVAFDDIKVAGLAPDNPQPDNHPASLMATAFGPSQIVLSWPDATGTNLPTGYVIYAGETSSLSVPVDGTPPTIDDDLSDGSAVVTVFHGDDTSYTFTGLDVSTTYHFQIWAYSNAGNRIDYKVPPAGPTASVTVFEPAVVFEEGFETDGHPSRYRASPNGGFRGGNDAHFQRTEGNNIDNVSGAYTGFSNSWFWAAEDTDNAAGNESAEQIIAFNKVSIAGFTGLSVSGLFAAGNERRPGASFAYDAHDYIRVSYQVDSGAETDVLCFRAESHDDNFNEPLGLDADCDGFADNLNGTDRLGRMLTEYSANITETGDFLTIRIKVAVTGSTEEIAFDDIKVAGLAPDPAPEPDSPPTAFMAIPSGLTQIDLSWTDAEGTNLPLGYVVYANTTGEFSVPADGALPILDTDLSDGEAVVNVFHGEGSSYTFTGLTALETYYFQIWAYSNAGSRIDYLTPPETPVYPATPAYPEPDNHPVAFTATRLGSSQINLSWTDAEGTNLPLGYVVYANTTGEFSVPADGAPPIIDTDLSDGTAVVTVGQGAGSSYAFEGLAASTTYHFQIWAYSNEGGHIDYLVSPASPTASGTTRISHIFGKAMTFVEEDFETDGHPSRYTASSSGGFRGGDNAHFQRTDGSDIANASGVYTGFSGTHFWAAEDTDNAAGDRNEEQTITFNPVDIAGWTDLSISGLFGAGNERLPGAGVFSYDGSEYIRLTYQIDLGEETDVLCFRVEDHGNRSNNPLGLDADCDGTADNTDGTDRLGTALVAYSADILETGNMLAIKIKVVMNGSDEEVAFDDIKVAGGSPGPAPTDHPTGFTASATSPTQIDLSWTDATGTNLPTGYVIYANTVENSLPVPTDGAPPIIDSDLSDGSAVVTVGQGAGSSYAFEGLTASTNYYFQIWAYSNSGSHIRYLMSPVGPTVSGSVFEPTLTVIFEEGFETNGHVLGRYTASSNGGFRFDNDTYFFRTNGTSPGIISTTSGAYTGVSGMYFWAAEDIGDKERTIVFNPIDIAGVSGLTISGLFGAGNETLPMTPSGFTYDATEYIRVSYQIDSGVEKNVLCFAYENHGDESNEPLGLDANCDGEADNIDGTGRLGTELAEYSAVITETGDFLTVRIKVFTNGPGEEMAFDDIKVSGFVPPEPENHPAVLTATASGPSQIDLSWPDATGTNLPTGYVIYANTVESSLPVPTDGAPPIIDSDLSDSAAVVTVNRGSGSGYTFVSLTGPETYYFQIWAYSNEGIYIDYLISPVGPTASVTVASGSEASGQTVLLEEGFETNGHPSRYRASSNGGFRAGTSAYFRRINSTIVGFIHPTSSDSYSGFSGTHFWAAEDTDNDNFTGGNGMDEQTITFNPVNIAGLAGLSISGLFGAGNENPPGTFGGYDADDYIEVTYEIDGSGTETKVLCFGYENHGDDTDEPLGLDADCDGFADNLNGTDRLGTVLTEYRADIDIPEAGNSLTIRIKVNVDNNNEEIAFDDIKVVGTPFGAQPIMGDAGWRLLSLPVAGGTVADIADNTAVQGIPGGANTDIASNLVIYDNSGAWESPANVGTAWGDGYGFALYFYNNTVAGSTTLPLILDATGVEPSSDVSILLNYRVLSSGSYYTLAGNPFVSNFDVSSITSTGFGIQNNVHFWNNGANGVGSYSVQDRGEGYIVSPWQGFWVEVFGENTVPTTAITFPTTGKTSTGDATGTFFSKEIANRGDIAFALSSQTTYDEALRLSFRETATPGYDVDDASKLRPLLSKYATMAFNSNGVLKSVESLPWELAEAVTVPMEESLVGVSGRFTLAWKGLESVPADWALTFHDYETGTNLDMRSVSEYTFEVAAPVVAKVNPLSILTGPAAVVQKSKTAGARFAITIAPHTANTEEEDKASVFALEQNYPNPFNPSTVINYSVANSGKVSLSVYNLLGQKVAQLVNEVKPAGSYNVTWNATASASGMYYYRLEAGDQALTRKMMLIK